MPAGSVNFAFISQFVEIPDDVVFTVEYEPDEYDCTMGVTAEATWVVPGNRPLR